MFEAPSEKEKAKLRPKVKMGGSVFKNGKNVDKQIEKQTAKKLLKKSLEKAKGEQRISLGMGRSIKKY